MWSLFTFGQLPCFFLHTWPTPGPSPTWVHNFFKKNSTAVACWGWSTFVMGCCPHHLDLNESSYAYIVREVSLTLGVALLFLLQQSSAPTVSFVLEYLGKTELQFYSTWQTPAVQPRGPSQAHQFMYMKWSYQYLTRQSSWILTILCRKI